MSQNRRDWWAELERENPTPPKSIQHFRSSDWLRRYVDDPAYRLSANFSRILKPNHEDYFFSVTVATPSTIPHYICLIRQDLQLPEDGSGATYFETPARHQKEPWPAPAQPDMIFLLSLGAKSLDGHPEVLHGGMCCAIMDETQGMLMTIMCRLLDGPYERKSFTYTGNLSITYRAPIPTPGDILVRAWFLARQGRKWVCRAQLVDKDGKVCAESDGLFITVPNQRL